VKPNPSACRDAASGLISRIPTNGWADVHRDGVLDEHKVGQLAAAVMVLLNYQVVPICACAGENGFRVFRQNFAVVSIGSPP
jgi:hypothetical protein